MLEGRNIRLTPLEEPDLLLTRTWANDRDLQNLVLRVLPVTELEQKAWYRDVASNPSKIVFAIKTKDENRHIGNTGFYHIDWLHRRAEFWCLIGDRDFWGKKVGNETLKLMLDFGFNNLNFHKVYLHVGADNQRAVNLYKRFNFHEDGRLPNHYFMEGEYTDVLVMSLLKKEYASQK